MRLLIGVLAVVVALGAKWNVRNDPKKVSFGFNYKLAELPKTGEAEHLSWSDTYWPSMESGIAHRWNTDEDPEDFKYKPNSKEDLQKMSYENLTKLSPAEKYDILNDRYDYPTVNSEWQRTSPQDAGWEGICHGWAPASLNFRQPNPVNITNSDGIMIPFGSSDIKALLSFYMGQFDTGRTWFVADRCNNDLASDATKETIPACMDQDAGSFHVIMTNIMGLQKKGFVIDRDRSIQVWNQPFHRFNVDNITELAAPRTPGANSSVQVTVSITYGKETSPRWNSHPVYEVTEQYNYYLDLDLQGRILGGEHIAWDRPDFSWFTVPNAFHGYFQSLDTLYKASTATTPRFESEYHFEDLPSISTLTTSEGFFNLKAYESDNFQGWSIAPTNLANDIEIVFSDFSTERYRDVVKVYEGAKGDGALIAVLHGDISQHVVRVKSDGALVLFSSDSTANGRGFKASYHARSVFA